MRSFSLVVDGVDVDPQHVTFELHGQRIPVALLPQIDEIWWQPCDVATVSVRGRALDAGLHRITWAFQLPLVNFTPVVDRHDIYPSFEATIDVELDLIPEEVHA
jgi:hypothetical protein